MPRGNDPYTEGGAAPAFDDEEEEASLNDYELIRQIGRGGMGVVYEAHQRSLNRRVALKMLPSAVLVGDDGVERFRIEAEAAAQIDHPNIVPVHEIGEENGQPFIAMKLIEGASLANADQQLLGNPKKVVAIMIKVARAVEAAHQRGILHRDLKPGNILLDLQSGEPYVGDFGLAKRLDIDEDEPGLTLTGQVLGTPGFMAPEQALGKQLTIAADVYGLGGVFYFMLTGNAPFSGGNVAQILRQIESEPPSSPSSTTQGIDRDLDAIAMKCLEKEPRHRYATAAELAEDLDRWMRREPVFARRIKAPQRVIRWARRNPIHAGFATTAALLLLTLAVGGPIVAMTQSRLRAEAEENGRTIRHRLYGYEMSVAGGRMEQGFDHRQFLEAWEPSATPNADDLYGWEWDYLQPAPEEDAESLFQRADSGYINGFDVVSEGRRIIYATDIRISLYAEGASEPIWDADSKGGAAHVAVSASERLFAATTHTGVSVGNLETGDEIQTFDYHKPSGYHDAFRWSPKRESIAWIEKADSLKVYDFERGEVVAAINPGEAILAYDWTAPGEGLILAFADRFERWPLEDGPGKEVIYRSDVSMEIFSMAVSPNGTKAAVGLRKESFVEGVYLFDFALGEFTEFLEAPQIDVIHLSWGNDETQLTVSSSMPNPARIWNLGEFTSISIFNRDANKLIFGKGSNVYQLLNEKIVRRSTSAPRRVVDLKEEDSYYSCLSWSPDGKWLVGAGKQLFVVNAASVEFVPRKFSQTVHGVCWGPSGDTLVIWDDKEVFEVPFDPAQDSELEMTSKRLIQQHGGGNDDVHLEITGRPLRLYARCRYQFLAWDFHSSNIVWEDDQSAEIAIHPTDPSVVVSKGHEDDFLKQFDLSGSDSEELWDLAAHEVWALNFHPNGKMLATNRFNDIKLWSYPDGKLIDQLRGHTNFIHRLAFSPDGSRLASSSKDGTIRIWNPESGVQVLQLQVNDIAEIAWSPDGKSLAALDYGGVLRIWRSGE